MLHHLNSPSIQLETAGKESMNAFLNFCLVVCFLGGVSLAIINGAKCTLALRDSSLKYTPEDLERFRRWHFRGIALIFVSALITCAVPQ